MLSDREISAIVRYFYTMRQRAITSATFSRRRSLSLLQRWMAQWPAWRHQIFGRNRQSLQEWRNFSQSRIRAVGKADGCNNGPAEFWARSVELNAIRRAGNAKRDRLRGNGILSSSADGPLISAAATFPKCFVPRCFEPCSPSPRVYRDCHCLLKQSAVINPERFLRKLWPAGGQTARPTVHAVPRCGIYANKVSTIT